MKKLTCGMLMAGIMVTGASAHAELIINELMQSNIDCIMDDLNEFPDSWVELYNAGNESVNLSDYALSVSPKEKKAYKLPSRTVAPGQYVVVYCDKEEKDLHASFRLESGKDGELYLWKNGTVIEQYTGMKKMPAPNVAYGRETDGSDTWGYQLTPTPGKANCGRITKEVLGDPMFSKTGHVAKTTFALELSLPEDAPAGTQIRYTLDGTEPTVNSTLYTKTLAIDDTKTVRAALFKDGAITPRSVTNSYIFLGRDMTLPVVSLVTDRNYFYSNNLGIYNENNNGANARNDWRRPVNMEVFRQPETESVINQLCETRVKGGASRGNALKSLVMYANKRFGTKRFEHEFFPDDAAGLTDWKSIELRNAGNDFDYLYLRDALIQRNMGRRADLDWQPWQPAIVLINGEYKGILNMRPRSNEDYVYTFYDGLEDVTVVENWWELKEGEQSQLDAFKAFYEAHGHTYEEFDAVMDVSEFCNLMIVESFHNNLDFPGNNIEMWRPIADGGRWRWIVKDTDFGMGLYGRASNYKYLNWLYDHNFDPDNSWANNYDHTRLFRRLMDIDRFKNMFIDRFAVYMGDFLNGTVLSSDLDDMTAVIKSEYQHHRKLFNEWWPNYDEEVGNAKKWARERTTFFYNHLADYLKLGKAVPVTVDKGRSDDIKITMNDVPLSGRSFDGKFFVNRKLTLTGHSDDPDHAVTGWRIHAAGAPQQDVELVGATVEYTIPASATSVTITTVAGDGSGINEVTSEVFDMSAPYEVYSISGARLDGLDALPTGVYILKQGTKSKKVIKN